MIAQRVRWVYNDGGRAEAGWSGTVGDCVARSIAIVSGLPYSIVYDALAKGNKFQRRSKYTRGKPETGVRTASHGIWTQRKWFKDYMASIGFVWTPTMQIGSGCRVHLRADELPAGRIICAVSHHYCAVIDGIIHDNHDPSRDGTRCVYGFWQQK